MNPIIEIENLTKKYSQKEVLKGVNLKIYPGQIIGYIGPNGAGKSTTVKILLGLIEDYSGTVKIFGEDIRENSVDYKFRIGYVPELGDIYDTLTAKEYLTFLGDLYEIDKDLLLERANELTKLFGINEQFNARITSYSKGMKQKLLIIASMIHNPDILFLDEPITGLDANSVMIFKEILNGLAKKGKTIFYSSHIMEVVENLSERIVLLNDGIIAADGSFDELKNNGKNDSLEDIFNEVTGFNNHKEIAESFVTAICR
ncbi:ABC transporter ATP-binding protein [Helicovermis profundi]|uniref:ABC transporter ATP-binding protein n=1 Tax=Helicovermis profundi TaxID=3065157 RepID=A0AAU9EEF7_9FIRM|nr:ABC transporter ATP-binding protein [Clostridia bacterium S502]